MALEVAMRSTRLFSALLSATFLSGLLVGCGSPAPSAPPPVRAAEPAERHVTVVRPERKTIHRVVGQPGVIEAFERTPIVSKIAGYVLKWNVDIGDPIRKDMVLADLWVPEMVSELKLKDEMVEQARKALAMAQARVVTAKAQVQEVLAGIAKAEANHGYWKTQSARFNSLVGSSVLDKQTQEETLNQLRSAAASLSEVQAKVQSAEALKQEREFARDKAEVDVRAAEADRRRQADMVAYATLTAPYDGVVTQRNINTRQFVQPATGGQGDVLYVIERTDIVRVFVSVPEADADRIRAGSPATVRVQALQGQELKGHVTRTAWSLNRTSRTLLAEVDLPNPELPKTGRRLRPGMYAYATIDADWPDVLTLPAAAVVTEGDVNVGYKSYCYVIDAGRARRVQIETGARSDDLIEVLKKLIASTNSGEKPRWEDFAGNEQIATRPAELTDGQAVGFKVTEPVAAPSLREFR
jgi:multidrug efflux pump subunit AcrA (membrane-fusion protein)